MKTSLVAVLGSAVLGFSAHAQNASSAKGVTLTPLDPALVEVSRPTPSSQFLRVNFVNQSGSAVDIYWINYEGKRVLKRANLSPGASWEAVTYLTHPWLIVASGTGGTTEPGTGARLVGFEASTSNDATALITDVPGAGVPPRHMQDATPRGESNAAERAPGVVLSPLDAAITDDALRSTNVSTPAQINFVNQSGGAIDIYWINYEGKRVLYRGNLAPGATWQAHTFFTHPWLAVATGTGGTTDRDTGVRLAGFEAFTPNGDTALIR